MFGQTFHICSTNIGWNLCVWEHIHVSRCFIAIFRGAGVIIKKLIDAIPTYSYVMCLIVEFYEIAQFSIKTTPFFYRKRPPFY